MKPTVLLSAAMIFASACTEQSDDPQFDPSEIETAARQFQDFAHAFNYSGLRNATTPIRVGYRTSGWNHRFLFMTETVGW